VAKGKTKLTGTQKSRGGVQSAPEWNFSPAGAQLGSSAHRIAVGVVPTELHKEIKTPKGKTKLTGAQAVVRYLIGEKVPYAIGIFGHGNVQLGQALHELKDSIRFVCAKNEQTAVHIALAYAKLTGQPLAVTSSIGPGSTNLVTGAAVARVNRLPVVLLAGEAFADGVGPVLQQLESLHGRTANDTLEPVSKYWTRISRPEQLRRRLREAFDAMLEPGDEGPATICLPMDVQAEAAEFDVEDLLHTRDREYVRVVPERHRLRLAARRIAAAKRPLILAGGGVLRSGAERELAALAELLAAPVAMTQAGKGTLLFDHPLNVFSLGPTGTWCGNRIAKKADLVVGIGTRYTDFSTASETLFESRPEFVNVSICYDDVGKERGLKLWGDARETVSALRQILEEEIHWGPRGTGEGREYVAGTAYFKEIQAERQAWLAEADRWRTMEGTPIPQSTGIAIINDFVTPQSVVISAAGNLPGDLSKLWRDKDPRGYLCEWGFSTMGYEVAAGLGAKLACPDREVVVCVGDMSFLMASQEIVTAVQHGLAYTVVVFDNGGGQSIRHLQKNSDFSDFAMEFRRGTEFVALDFAKLAEGMGAYGLRAESGEELATALHQARKNTDRPTVIHLRVERENMICDVDAEAWWDVPRPALDVDGRESESRKNYLASKAKQIVL